DPGTGGIPAAAVRVDREPTGWLRLLAATGPVGEAALARLPESWGRATGDRPAGLRLRITSPDLEDLAFPAAADALVAITGRTGQFRGRAGSPPGHMSALSSRFRPTADRLDGRSLCRSGAPPPGSARPRR